MGRRGTRIALTGTGGRIGKDDAREGTSSSQQSAVGTPLGGVTTDAATAADPANWGRASSSALPSLQLAALRAHRLCKQREHGAIERVRARPGPSKVAKKPSPVVLISRPRKRSSSARVRPSWVANSSDHRRSPMPAAWSVEPTTSVNITVGQHPVDVMARKPAGDELLDGA